MENYRDTRRAAGECRTQLSACAMKYIYMHNEMYMHIDVCVQKPPPRSRGRAKVNTKEKAEGRRVDGGRGKAAEPRR